jgi:hypothetical protein
MKQSPSLIGTQSPYLEPPPQLWEGMIRLLAFSCACPAPLCGCVCVCVCFVLVTCWEQGKNTTNPMPHSLAVEYRALHGDWPEREGRGGGEAELREEMR